MGVLDSGNMFWGSKRILVTGGTGFIGSSIVQKLIGQSPIICVVDKNLKQKFSYGHIEYHEADIADKPSLGRIVDNFKPEYIIHLAANNSHEESSDIVDDIKKTNVEGTRNMLELTKNLPYKRFVFLSSGEVYFGNTPPFRETMEVKGPSSYSQSKIESEKDCKTFIEKHKKPIVILRASIVYGNGQKAPMFIPSMIESSIKNRVFEMTKGEQTRDFLFVLDLVDAIIKACIEERAIGETINIGCGNPISLLDATKTAEMMLPDFKKRIGAKEYRKNEIFEYYFDTSKAKQILNWCPKYSLEEGLAKTIQWYRSQK